MSTTDSTSKGLFRSPKWLEFPHSNHPISPFPSYLETRGLKLSSQGSESPHLLAKLQNWLTFGLLESITQSPIPKELLVSEINGSPAVLTRSNIPSIMSTWVSTIRYGKTEEYKIWCQKVNATLIQLRSIMLTMVTKRVFFSNPSILPYDDAAATVLFIGCIAESISSAKMAFHPSILEPMGFSMSVLWGAEFIDAYERELVREKGWCAFTVNSVIGTLGLCALEYLGRVGGEGGGRHRECTREICKANMVDVENYKPKHVEGCDDGSCVYSKPDAGAVVGALTGGDIPIIMIEDIGEEGTAGSIRIDTHKSHEVPYLAISHVWADGLGSTTEAGLPTCQIRRISNLVSNVLPKATGEQSKISFWMDSLCIPNDPSVRKKAIGMMARTYTEAAAVLVLDSALLSIPSTLPREELAVQILLCGWMKRLWTLQEAVLAKKLFFLCSDGVAIQLSHVLPEPESMPLYPAQNDIAAELFRLMKWRGWNTYTIGDVARALRWRATSRASDETLAIASLLDKDPASLAGLPAAVRMKELLLRLKEVPRNILFLSADKMDIDGFRWAPLSFMATHGGAKGGYHLAAQSVKEGGEMSVVTEEGLDGLYYAILFPLVKVKPGETWGLIDKKRGNYYLVKEPENRVKGDYRCNLILLEEAIRRGSASKGIAASRIINESDINHQQQRAVCRYHKRVIISDCTETDFQRESGKDLQVSDITAAGLLNIRVT
ncbi:hypothetical protein TWF481_006368 [Arthrobotrys musiformis]|uniref:Heterokaryon incompatibility domain-containing protein n=1 Tax=Arthrobotrys musiformis TaxID=47236 RepID=A0AAV9WGG7_9PEZI